MTEAPSYEQLCKRAKISGHNLTPELKAELRLLSAVTDDDLQAAYEAHVTREIAMSFGVPKPAMERRLGDSIPRLVKGDGQ